MSEGGPKTAVVLLSGGLDSSVTLVIAIDQGYRVHALTVDYGQRHQRELDAARAIAGRYGLDHKTVRVDLSAFGGSALTNGLIKIPSSTPEEEIGSTIPPTYVPGRNTVFISMAVSWAEALDAEAVFIGANAVDYSGYPDCRPEFIEAMQRVIDLGTKRGVEGDPIRIVAPILRSSKAEIVRRGLELGIPFRLTWSCYRGRLKACGHCDSCQLRLRGFADAGAVDPLEYEIRTQRPDKERLKGDNPGRFVVAELVEEDALEEPAGIARSRGGDA
ncbi:MAG: 7-cyano-7-deazaguanine synthase QueC [Thermoplasmata archaeon]|nr:7-cyano-7-deazaguanine synthase QueC [Thermoplasmata archaeon]